MPSARRVGVSARWTRRAGRSSRTAVATRRRRCDRATVIKAIVALAERPPDDITLGRVAVPRGLDAGGRRMRINRLGGARGVAIDGAGRLRAHRRCLARGAQLLRVPGARVADDSVADSPLGVEQTGRAPDGAGRAPSARGECPARNSAGASWHRGRARLHRCDRRPRRRGSSDLPVGRRDARRCASSSAAAASSASAVAAVVPRVPQRTTVDGSYEPDKSGMTRAETQGAPEAC